MAKNDMEVIMYKILRYLYECMKYDIEPDLQKYAWKSDLFDVPKGYWCKIICILVEKKLITGFSVIKSKDGTQVQLESTVEITYEGREFLRDNSGMKKAEEFCKDTFDTILSSALGLITL